MGRSLLAAYVVRGEFSACDVGAEAVSQPRLIVLKNIYLVKLGKNV